MFSLFKNSKKIDYRSILAYFLILLVSLLTWKGLLHSSIVGEGPLYLLSRNQDVSFSVTNITFLHFGSRILGRILLTIFGLNIKYYFIVELINILMINTLVYYIFLITTKNRLMSFVMCLLMATHYMGNWEMYVASYAYYMERIPNMFVLLLSFLFLVKYHVENGHYKKIFYILSVLFFLLSMQYDHWSILFAPILICYGFFVNILNSEKVKAVIEPLPFLLIGFVYMMIQSIFTSILVPTDSFVSFLVSDASLYFKQIFSLATYWPEFTIIPKSLYAFFHNNSLPYLYNVDTAQIARYSLLISLFYLLVFWINYIFFPKLRVLLFTSVVATMLICVFVAYMGTYHPDMALGSNRYLYIPTFTLSVFWGMFLTFLCTRNNFLIKIMGVSIALVFILTNYLIIQQQFKWHIQESSVSNQIVNYSKANAKELSNKVVLVPTNSDPGGRGYLAEFLTEQLGKNYNTTYLHESGNWEKENMKKLDVVRLKYADCLCIEVHGVHK